VTGRAFDVAIVGGGPAGCATGLSLRAHAPELRAGLVEASDYESPRIGETLPPLARRLLEHLGVWEAFRRQGHREVHGTAAAWGGPIPQDNEYLFGTQGNGWHLDRSAFDALLAGEAESRGVTLLRQTRVRRAERDGDIWRLRAGGETLTARFLVDATGASAALARRCGARFVVADRLAGFARLFEETGTSDPRTLVEAFADGWWYTAGLPGGLRIAACLTDADLARPLRLAEPAAWTRRLEATERIRDLLQGARPQGPIVIRAAHSRRLEPAAGDGWLAVGDAASLFDPLSSQGILKGLRSGIFASYAIGDFLTKEDETGLQRYRRYVREELESYSRVRARYYAEEQRWPESPFWRRRSEAGGREALRPG
jgi:flavin-dependent dehydrogenase